MRIQETDKVLKEARFARRAAGEETSGISKSWLAGVVALLAVAGLVAYFRNR
jgi:hypothetical protein